MVDLKESFHESVIIKRAKRRLIGAVAILIILFTLSLFFVKDPKHKKINNEIKVSFLEMGPASFREKMTLKRKSFLIKIQKNYEKKLLKLKTQ